MSGEEARERMAAGSLLSGREAAMARMKAAGEEWAEEEDIPGLVQGSNGAGSAGGLGKTDTAVGVSQKELMQSMSRMNALKKEKRKSRMYS